LYVALIILKNYKISIFWIISVVFINTEIGSV
jgi:hypothetical protein